MNTITKTNYGAVDYRENEIMRSVADLTNIKADIQWEPKYDLRNGLMKTIEWERVKLNQIHKQVLECIMITLETRS